MYIAPISILLMAMMAGITPSLSLVAFDCADTASKRIELSLVDQGTCSPITRNITETQKTIQLIQPRIFDEVEYIQCLIEINHHVYRCGRVVDTFHSGGYYNELYEIGETDCRLLIKEGWFNYHGIKIRVNKKVDVNFVSLETIGSIEGGSCTGGQSITLFGKTLDHPVQTSAFTIRTKRGVGTIDIEESKLITEDGTQCDYQLGSCLTGAGGYTYWSNIFHDPSCHNNDNFIVLFEGLATEIIESGPDGKTTSYLLRYNEYDFQIVLTGKRKIVCGSVAFITEHPKLSVIIHDADLPFALHYDKNKLGKNINIMTYLNSKIVYATHHIKQQVESLYDYLMRIRCNTERKLLQSILTSALTDPHHFAYQHMGREGYTATLRGEVIYIVACQPVVVNFTVNNPSKCYQEIPVEYHGRPMFITPRSRILTDVGTPIDCSSILPVKYKLQNNWFAISPAGLLLTKEPQILSIQGEPDWKYQEIKNLATAGIYSQGELDRIDKVILSSVRSNSITQQVNSAITGVQLLDDGIRVSNMLSVEDLEKLGKSKLQEFLDNVVDKLGWFGNVVAVIIGISVIIRIIRAIVHPIINFISLRNKGWGNWRLLFIWWDHMSHFLAQKNPPRHQGQDIEMGVPYARETEEEKTRLQEIAQYLQEF